MHMEMVETRCEIIEEPRCGAGVIMELEKSKELAKNERTAFLRELDKSWEGAVCVFGWN